MGRRRQFRADRRRNHPRPCPPLLSGPSGGPLPSHLPRRTPCRSLPVAVRLAGGGGGGRGSEGGENPMVSPAGPVGSRTRWPECAHRLRSVPLGPRQPRDKRACRLSFSFRRCLDRASTRGAIERRCGDACPRGPRSQHLSRYYPILLYRYRPRYRRCSESSREIFLLPDNDTSRKRRFPCPA